MPHSPRITPRVVDYGRSDSLIAAFAGAGAVVHLAGILFESRTSDYRSGNVGVTRAVVEAAQAAAVRHLVFVSSLGADPRSRNGYFRSKGEAERIVADSGIDATIIRTPLLLGPGTAGGRSLRCTPRPDRRPASSAAERTGCARSTSTICAAPSWGAASSRPAGVRTCELVGPDGPHPSRAARSAPRAAWAASSRSARPRSGWPGWAPA